MDTNTSRDAWAPNWATHPGEHLAEHLEVRGWSQAEFARLAGLTPKLVSTILSGANPVSSDTAIKLERVLGLRAEVWMNLQSNWDLYRSRERSAALQEERSWIDRFPVRELQSRGALPATKNISILRDELLCLLGIGSEDAYDAKVASLAVQHRQSQAYESSRDHIVVWLMLGERKARETELASFEETRFLNALTQIRSLTREEPEIFEPKMRELCRRAGVALVLEKPINQTRLFGSARWLTPQTAMIQMSLRLKTNDHFWWTFFHEAAHLLLHRGRSFVDGNGFGGSEEAEKEADAWASDFLVRDNRLDSFVAGRPRSAQEVRAFADQVGLHPGIVVGMLQHKKALPHSHLNHLKAKFEWVPG